MIDENAFGILIAHYDLESIEYSLEPAAFLEHLARFRACVERMLIDSPVASRLRRLEFGHGTYLELGAGEQLTCVITWIREMRRRLVEADLPNVCLLAAGGRWLGEGDEVTEPSDDEGAGSPPPTYGPSEPLRKVMAAEASAQPTTSGEQPERGWGPGLYIDQEAIEQLGKSLKNAPTSLPVLSSIFYRIGN